MTRYRVEMTAPAEADLEQIRRWLMIHADADVADRLLLDVLACLDTLEQFPERGSVPAALDDLDETIRQMPVQAWRLLYDVSGEVVSILAVVHERRNLTAALSERLRR
ncbi:type II toxin-antitoxin system RelE/ParE family toxin [Sphingomonas corticis]|jgi:toxin ParE1/3/4|uniref:Type II toxin-antitoxin system RelE/ParE family toxin n=1 Tax=Sphingomonas corticis TaxID=2722791 RepID=A0ABX1CU60_9SPHN|nr:type II toxin-antitoxin system RelE/ParE family toxin [Sphingomonas corticis]NJR80351.1 type II toxin-antitoxin system RelE/ParE family toxin [Sphingomonas corticis]